jgi:antitoxin MazE
MYIHHPGGFMQAGRSRVQKWGNSLGIRIQKAVAEEAKIKEGSEVAVTVDKNRIIIVSVSPRYTLEGLLSGVTPENIHGETDTGSRMGLEEW